MAMPDPEKPRVRKRSPRGGRKKTRKKTARKPPLEPDPPLPDAPATRRRPPPLHPPEKKPKKQQELSEVELVRRAIADLYEFVGNRRMPGLRPKVVDLEHSLLTVIDREGLV